MAHSSFGASRARGGAADPARFWLAQAGGALLALLVLLALAPALGKGLERVRYTVPSPSPDDGLEGTLLHEAQIVRRGEPLYRPVVADEFVSAPYTPGYTVVLAAWPLDPAAPFSAGRTISLVAMLLVGAGIGLFVGLHTRLWWLGLIAALCWLAFAPAQLWGTRLKPDALALACTTLGLCLASVRDGRLAAWSAIPFALAFLTKQTALLAPFAVGLNLLFTNHRRAIHYGLVCALAFAAPYFSLDVATGGWASAHIWGLHQRSWWSFALFWKYVELLKWSLPLVGLALLALPEARRNHAYRQALLFMVAAPAAMYGAGEIGAHHNHLLEPMLAFTLAGGLGAGLAFRRWGDGLGRRLAVGAAALLLVIQGLALRETPAWYGGEFFPPSLERYVTYLSSKPGPVLADNVALVVSAGKPLPFDDPSTMGPAIRSGLWDPAKLHEAIRARQFDAILLEVDIEAETKDASGRWTDETLELIKAHYQLEFRDTLKAYVPRP
ncbi:MAG TPA: hypothetical protein VGE07_13210 [Herpetosiphonaceae bacterium]